MSLIICPECGKEISSQAESCPHCGFPIKKIIDEVVKNPSNKSEPLKDTTWTAKWFKKASSLKASLAQLWIANLGIAIIMYIVCFTLKESVKTILYLILGRIFIGLSGVIFIIFIVSLISTKVKRMKIDGYTIVVYATLINHILIIENKIVEKTSNRTLNGKLPNGREIIVNIALPDSSIQIISK
jgi:hypothetical protein